MKPIFGRGPSLPIRLALAVVASLLLIIADSRYHSFTGAKVYLNSLVSPLQYMANSPRLLLDAASSQLMSRQSLLAQSQRLDQELFLLRDDLLRLRHLEQENQRLRDLLGSPVRFDTRRMVAEIMAVDTDPFSHQVVIDKGSLEGVFEGQPVLNEQGVVGQVISVGKTTSRVLLITDTSHGIPVRVARNDIRAIASGSGQLDRLLLHNITRNTDIREGDVLLSSGLAGRFPEGYPVGRVSRVGYEEGQPFADIRVQPFAALDRVRYLLLLWPEPKVIDVDDVASEQAAEGAPQ
ncbi:rod shape-determining protein MreC [Oceanisphaera arctica]|uniref:Cell shape-determining protein MreC n=1 Tax=Oceanisphaera arctica TaxID=641510 RepID=A0A2P5TKT0_9GAMM|nr:rod shape-determining protein MreC [Oceanisphaera arctica]PPL15728.1 rod shape-determining protein MreC [Oceanisphaera arctica]GHA04820.1 cell shape-determining protein MreC [Oceanisphaera arctica]